MFWQSTAVDGFMSRCEYKVVTSGIPADIEEASTTWVPSSMEDANVNMSLF